MADSPNDTPVNHPLLHAIASCPQHYADGIKHTTDLTLDGALANLQWHLSRGGEDYSDCLTAHAEGRLKQLLP